MQYREMGNTGLRLSVIGFGAGDNAGLFSAPTPGVDKPAPFEDQCRVLARALELGVNYVDTAAGYGDNNSERNLGKVLKELRVHPIINSKFELVPDGLNDIPGFVERSVEASLKRLGVDYLDIVQIHNQPRYHRSPNATFTTTGPWLNLEVPEYMEAIEGLRRLRQSGKARFTGFADVGPDQPLLKAMFATGEVSLLNQQYNLINPTPGMPKPPGLQVDQDDANIITYAMEHGCGVSVVRPLFGGALTDNAVAGGASHPLARDNRRRNPEGYGRLVSRAAAFKFLSIEGRSLQQAAIQWILLHPGVTTVLGGFGAVEQVEENVAALSAPPLTETELARIDLAWRANLGA